VSCMGMRMENILPKGRVEEAYLLVDTTSKNVETLVDKATRVTFPDLRNAREVNTTSLQ